MADSLRSQPGFQTQRLRSLPKQYRITRAPNESLVVSTEVLTNFSGRQIFQEIAQAMEMFATQLRHA